MTDFYTIETPPPSSSTSKDSLDASITSYRTKNRIKLVSTHLGQISNQSNSLTIKINEVREFWKYLLNSALEHDDNLIDKMMTHIEFFLFFYWHKKVKDDVRYYLKYLYVSLLKDSFSDKNTNNLYNNK